MKRSDRWKKIFSFNRAVPIGFLLAISGIGLIMPLVTTYIHNHLRLSPEIGVLSHHALIGIVLILAGAIYFTTSLLFNTIMLSHSARLFQHDM